MPGPLLGAWAYEEVSMKGELILNIEKNIRGIKVPAGAVIAIIETEPKITVEDVDISLQLNEVRISTVPEKKK